MFRKGLTAWGALIVILWSLDLALPLFMPATTQVVTLGLVSGAVITVLSVFLAYKGNGLIARKYLARGYSFAKPDSVEARYAIEKWGLPV